MLEIGTDAGRRALDAPQRRKGLSLQVGSVPRGQAGVHIALEIAVERLVGVELGRLGWQEEQADLRRVARDPGRDDARLVDRMLSGIRKIRRV
jgi:hypothetical protein